MFDLPEQSQNTREEQRRLLVVDDDPQVARMLRRLLAASYAVTIVSDGAEALAKIVAGERFDVILTNLMMPNLTGIGLYEKVLILAPEQAAKMIFMTGSRFERTARDFLDGLEGRWIDKPFERKELLELVHRMANS